MAGFDFDVPYKESDLSLIRALLAKFQRVCRSYDLEAHYRRSRDNDWRFWVIVDGPLPMMQAVLPVLAATLPAYAEGAPNPPVRRQRVQKAERILEGYSRGVLGAARHVQDLADLVGGTPNSFYFEAGEHNEELAERLRSLTMTLIAYENGMIQPPQMLEEIHTAFEWVMQELINPLPKCITYAQMAETLRDSGRISSEQAAEIIQMKDLRVGAKHRGQAVSRQQVNDRLPPCLEALHRLLRD